MRQNISRCGTEVVLSGIRREETRRGLGKLLS